ncbi:hypothetical protein LRP88_06598 [Fusarium phalaenopsidis]
MENSATFPDLAGKVAIVTGIGQIGTRERWGNGAATARLLCHNGVKVFGCDIDIDAASYTKTRIEAEGGTVEITQADVTSSADVKRLVSECVAKFGKYLATELNIKSVYLTCHEVLPIMEAQKAGAVVNVASIAGMRYIGKPQVAYSTFKAGVMQFTKATAVIYAARGVRLNTVVPGLMNTPLMVYLANKYAGGDLEGFSAKRDKAVPMGKQGDSLDVANAIVFLASESAKYITGQELVVDGGITSSTG